MRRYTMVGLSLIALVAGCSTFSAHSDVIEQADGQQFTAQQLADILNGIKAPIQFNTQIGTFVTNLWTDATLFTQAVAKNQLVTDSTLVSQSMWLTIAEVRGSRWFDSVLAHKAAVSDATIDSAYKADQLRVVQHLLIKSDSTEPKAQRDEARHKADSLLKLIRSGASFSKIAYENTADDGSKADSGYYPPKPRSMWVKPFGDALWGLKPGEVSGVVPTQYGYHIIRRPTEQEASRFWRDTLTHALAPSVMQAYYKQLSADYGVKVEADAIPHMRAAVADLDAHQADHTALTTFKGGTFTTGDLVHWVRSMTADPAQGPAEMQQIRQAPDSIYRRLVEGLTQEQLLLKEADKNNVRLTPAEWQSMQTAFTAAVDSLKITFGMVPPAYDAKASEHDRSVEAGKLVDQYFKDLVNQKSTPRALPGVLAATLRERAKTHFNPVALEQGLDIARAKHAADSAKAGPAALPPAIQPAPGAAPVPGGDTGAKMAPKKP